MRFFQPAISPGDLRQQQSWQWTFTIGLEELAKEQVRLPATAVGWRYIIGNRLGQALSATVDSNDKLVGLSRGPAVTAGLRVARELKTLPEAADGKYEIRLLTIPGLLTEAFWLKSLDGKPDLIVPFSTEQELRLGYPYSIEKFLKIMRPLAEDWLRGWAEVSEGEAENKRHREQRSAERRQLAEKRLADERETQIRTRTRQIIVENR